MTQRYRTYLLSLGVFLVGVVGGGLAIGFLTAPGEWYAQLRKPWFTPPGWLFAPVWTLLYVMIAVAGWRTWLRAATGIAMTLWFIQMGLNFLWSPTFFSAHNITGAFGIILALLASILGFIIASGRRDVFSMLLFLPYAGWVAFASMLNGSILAMN